MRAVGYPLVSFTVPFLWWTLWRDRMSFPWLPDLLITITCFTDILGNRMDLYDTVVWFDDWMHFMSTGLLAAAIVLLTLAPGSGLLRIVERALAFGATSAIACELVECFAFISRTSDRSYADGDTLGDLALGTAGCGRGGRRRAPLVAPEPAARSAIAGASARGDLCDLADGAARRHLVNAHDARHSFAFAVRGKGQCGRRPIASAAAW